MALMFGVMTLMTVAGMSRLAAEVAPGFRSDGLWLAATAWSVSLIWLAARLLFDAPDASGLSTAGC